MQDERKKGGLLMQEMVSILDNVWAIQSFSHLQLNFFFNLYLFLCFFLYQFFFFISFIILHSKFLLCTFLFLIRTRVSYNTIYIIVLNLAKFSIIDMIYNYIEKIISSTKIVLITLEDEKTIYTVFRCCQKRNVILRHNN